MDRPEIIEKANKILAEREHTDLCFSAKICPNCEHDQKFFMKA